MYLIQLDFAIVYCVHYENEEFGSGSILIHNSHLTMWNCTTQDLDRLATENTPRLHPLSISTMERILAELDCQLDDEAPSDMPVYVMSNETKKYGAICIRYKDSLKDLANMLNSDAVILPSSVHEVILLPLRGNGNFKELRDMVHEVNRTHLSMEEFLSDNIYLYRRDTDNIEIV